MKRESQATKRNIVHVEIPAQDVYTTGKFYQELLGSKTISVLEMNYTLWELDEGPSSGFPEISDENPTGQVLICVNSNDIQIDLKKSETLGAKILYPKTEIPNTGWFGIFADPIANKIALYTSMDSEFNK